MEKANPFNVPKELLTFYKDPLEKVRFLYKYDLKDPDDASRLVNEIGPLKKYRMFVRKDE